MMARLGDFILEYSVRNRHNETIPVYSVTNDEGFCTGYFSKDVASKDKSTYKIVPKGYFAYNPSRINVGSIDWQRTEDRVLVSPLYTVFEVSHKVDQQYLYYYLKSDFILTYIKEYATGSVRDNLKLSELEKFPINVRSIDEQRKIAAELDQISTLIDKRRQQLEKLDLLVKAKFVEMFGDPVDNPKNWKLMTLNNCLFSIENGKSFVCSDSVREGDKPAILKLSAVTYGEYHPEENKAIFDEEMFMESAEVYANDLLFTRKNTPELVGMCTYIFETPKKLMMPDLIFRLNTNQECNKIFLWKLINHDSFRSKIGAIASGSAKSMSNISKERLGNLQIIVPPIDIQNQFDIFVRQIYNLKSKIKDNQEKLETLKKAQMQKYFG